MSDTAADPEETSAKSGKKSLILAILLALVGGAGGFYFVSSGLIPIGRNSGETGHMNSDSQAGEHEAASGQPHGEMSAHSDQAAVGVHKETPIAHGETVFVEVDPITISLNDSQAAQHLRFRAQLEVSTDFKNEVKASLPRVTDVMNSYLRALELRDLTGPMALVRLRSQMLRRVQVVIGKGRVRDLLVMEFVLN